MFPSNVHNLLNTHSPTLRNSMSASIKSSISTTQLQDIKVSSNDVLQAISNLKNGNTLWFLSSTSLRCLQVKILRRIWHLPRNSHTSIVLNAARISYIHNIIMYRYSKFISRCLDSECILLTLLYLTHSTLPTLLLVIIVCMVTLIPNFSLIMIHKQQILYRHNYYVWYSFAF